MPSGKQAGNRRAQRRQRAAHASAPQGRAPAPRGRLVPVVVVLLAAVLLVGVAAFALRTPAAAPTTAAQATSGPSDGAAAPAPQADSSGKTAVTLQDGAVRLAAGQLDDRRARYYTLANGGKTISFFLLKSSDGVIRAAFDACDVCYPARKGYHQEGDVMVCNNCGTRFPSTRINVERGGCNPSPLAVQVQGDDIVIQAADLESGAKYF